MRRGPVDVLAYVRALGIYARTPSLALAPLMTSLAGALLLMLVPPAPDGGGGGLSGGFMQFFVMLLDAFGLAVSLIVADAAWRYGRAPFEDAWVTARSKAPDILLAAVGFTFIINVASLIGGYLGNLGTLLLTAAAAFFFIYTIPAASIGGVPGFGALQASLDRVQRSYLSTLLLAAVIVLLFWLFAAAVNFVGPLLLTLSGFWASTAFLELLEAFLKAVGLGYMALIMARAYETAA